MALVKFELEDETWIYMEVDEKLPAKKSEVDEETQGLVGIGDEVVKKASQTLDKAMSSIKSVGNTIVKKLKSLDEPADEVEVKFGIKMSADLGAVVAKGSGEVNYEITLKWDDREKNKKRLAEKSNPEKQISK